MLRADPRPGSDGPPRGWQVRAGAFTTAQCFDGYNLTTEGPSSLIKKKGPFEHHARRMVVICSPLGEFLAMWSSHCQVKNRPHGDDSADPDYQSLLFSVARGSNTLCPALRYPRTLNAIATLSLRQEHLRAGWKKRGVGSEICCLAISLGSGGACSRARRARITSVGSLLGGCKERVQGTD